jgi:hypothetical protein
MPLISTRGAASSRGFGYLGAAGAASYALICTGQTSNATRFIIETGGSGTNWGNLNSWPSGGYYAGGQAGDTTKGYVIGGLDFGGGPNGGYNLSQLRYFTYATAGDTVSNSSLSTPASAAKKVSGNNNTRGVALLGANYNVTVFPVVPIEYWTTATGGSVGSFGSMSGTYGSEGSGACFNNTRILVGLGNKGQFGGGDTPISTINYVTTATTGNSSFFGNHRLGNTFGNVQTAASTTRGLFAGGSFGSAVSSIDTVTIASTGNTTSYSNLTADRSGTAGGTNNPTTALFFQSGSAVDKFTIASTATATSWGSINGYSIPGFSIVASPCNNNSGLQL